MILAPFLANQLENCVTALVRPLIILSNALLIEPSPNASAKAFITAATPVLAASPSLLNSFLVRSSATHLETCFMIGLTAWFNGSTIAPSSPLPSALICRSIPGKVPIKLSEAFLYLSPSSFITASASLAEILPAEICFRSSFIVNDELC